MKNLRWYIAGLLTLATVVNYLDRACLGVVAPVLKTELNINEKDFSYIISSFQFSYMLMMPVMGYILDRLGTKKGFSIAVFWWSLANMLHAFATGWRSMAFFRFLLGIGEAGNFPCVAKTVAEWFPPKEKTIALGFINLGSSVGGMVAPPIVIWLVLYFGWQMAFVITGAVGMLWLVLWKLFYYPLDKHPKLTREEREYILGGAENVAAADAAVTDDAAAKKGIWREVMFSKSFWGVAIARFFAEPAWQFTSYWIPIYFFTVRGMDLKQIAMFAWLPFLASDLGCMFGGFLSPWLMKRGYALYQSRKIASAVAAVLMMFVALIGFVDNIAVVIFLFCLAAFSHQALSGNLQTLTADIFPKEKVASANGLTGSFAYAGGIIFTLIVGALATTVGYTPLFIAMGCFDIIGVIILWMLLQKDKEVEE